MKFADYTEFGVKNLASFMFHANFSSIDLVVWVFWLTIGQSNNAAKFDRI